MSLARRLLSTLGRMTALVCALAGCAAAPVVVAPVEASPPASVTEARAWREVVVTLHAESTTPPFVRDTLLGAAETWRSASGGRVHITIVFDVDFASPSNLRAHVDNESSFVFGVPEDSDVVRVIDARFAVGDRTPLAATVVTPGRRAMVVFVVDRIGARSLRSVALHEFGHVAGLPDMPSFGSVMSGAHVRGMPPVDDLTAEDVALCRAAMLCP